MNFLRMALAGLFLCLGLLCATSSLAQAGAQVMVSPMGLENDYHPAVILQQSGNSWFVRVTSGKYAGQEFAVLKDWIRQEAPAAPQAPAAAPTVPSAAPAPAGEGQAWKAGDSVMASPMGLKDDYHPAVVLQQSGNSWFVRIVSGKYAGQEFAVLKDWIREGAAPQAANLPAPAAPTAPAPAPATPPAATQANPGGDVDPAYAQMMRDMEQTIADSKKPPAPVGPVAGSTPLQGLYLRQEQTFQGTALNHREDYYFFFPDGRVYHGVPPEGPARFQWEKETQRSPDRCGRYGIQGDKITFAWMTGRSYTWKITGTGNEFDLNMSPTVKVDRFPAPAQLSGTYDRGSVNTAAGLPTVALSSSYTFYPDGTVTLNGMKGTDTTTVTTTITETGRGTYRLSGQDLEIRWGGETWHCTAFPQYDGAPTVSPPAVSINGALFVRRG